MSGVLQRRVDGVLADLLVLVELRAGRGWRRWTLRRAERDGGGAADVGAVVVEQAVDQGVERRLPPVWPSASVAAMATRGSLVAGAQRRGWGRPWRPSSCPARRRPERDDVLRDVGRSAVRRSVTASRIASPPMPCGEAERFGEEIGVALRVRRGCRSTRAAGGGGLGGGQGLEDALRVLASFSDLKSLASTSRPRAGSGTICWASDGGGADAVSGSSSALRSVPWALVVPAQSTSWAGGGTCLLRLGAPPLAVPRLGLFGEGGEGLDGGGAAGDGVRRVGGVVGQGADERLVERVAHGEGRRPGGSCRCRRRGPATICSHAVGGPAGDAVERGEDGVAGEEVACR